MNNSEEVIDSLKKLRANYIDCGTPFVTDYTWGYCNGIEFALSLLEDRPPFYLDKGNKYDKIDLDKYPEYFL